MKEIFYRPFVSAGALRYRAWAQSWSSAADAGRDEGRRRRGRQRMRWLEGIIDLMARSLCKLWATPSFPSQPEGKIGLPRANPRGRLRSPS